MEEVDKNAKIIWDYMLMKQKLEKADAIILLGTNDIRVVDRTYEIWKEGFVPLIICTGGIAHQDDELRTGWNKSEAEVFRDRLVELSVPENVILIETESKNTGENIKNVRALLNSKKFNFTKFIAVNKPFMERRVYTSFRKQWPEVEIIVSSPQMFYDEYISSSKDVSKEVFINIMVGDLIRIKEYPKLGFQIEQEIPSEVWKAGQRLIELGYNKHLPK